MESVLDKQATFAQEKRFDWPLCYEAENFISTKIQSFLECNRFARQVSARMRDGTGTLLLDWVDHLILPARDESALRKVGFVEDPLDEAPPNHKSFWHPEAMLPRVLIDSSNSPQPSSSSAGGVKGPGPEDEIGEAVPEAAPAVLAIRAESVSDFMAAHALSGEPEGEPLSRFRRVLVSAENGARLEAIERRGYRG